MTRVAIRGCPRSGTHLGEWFLKAHFGTTVISSSRHRPWRPDSDPEKVLLMVKEPIPWVVSMHRYARKLADRAGSDKELMFGGISCVPCNDADSFWYFNKEHLIEYRNSMMDSWLSSEADIFHCPYISMIGSTGLIRRLLSTWLGEDSRGVSLYLPDHPLTEPRKKGERFDAEYYFEERWRNELILKTRLEIIGEIKI